VFLKGELYIMSQGFSNESNMTQNVTSKKMRDYGVPVFSRLCMTLERYCGVRVFNKKSTQHSIIRIWEVLCKKQDGS
jgi:hypothetical protein